MGDRFFKTKYCDRCGKDLSTSSRTMSMYNEDVICMECKRAEQNRSDYRKAADADLAEIKKGNFNFKGIGKTW